MTTIQTIHQYRCDLNQGPSEVTLKTPIMHQDSLGDVFRVAVWRGNKVVDLTGMTVRGFLYFASTRQTLLLEGSITDGCACVTLTSECYTIPGYASLVVQVQDGDIRHSLLKVNMCITRTGSEIVIDPGDILPTLPELLGQIAAMEQATAEARDAAAAADAAREGIQGDLAALTREIGSVVDILSAPAWVAFEWIEDEYIDNTDGTVLPYDGWHRTDYIDISTVESPLHFRVNGYVDTGIYNAFYDADKGFLSSFRVNKNNLTVIVPDGAKYMRLSCENSGTFESLMKHLSVETAKEKIGVDLLHADNIRGTVQTVTFNADGTPAKATYQDTNGVVLRTDTYSYADDTITETRTTANGTLRITTNLNSLTVEVE